MESKSGMQLFYEPPAFRKFRTAQALIASHMLCTSLNTGDLQDTVTTRITRQEEPAVKHRSLCSRQTKSPNLFSCGH